MMALCFRTPPGSTRGPIVLVFMLDKETLDRILAADPWDGKMEQFDQEHIKHPIKDLDIVIAFEHDYKKLIEFSKKKDISGLMKWLERGRVIKDDDCTPPMRLV